MLRNTSSRSRSVSSARTRADRSSATASMKRCPASSNASIDSETWRRSRLPRPDAQLEMAERFAVRQGARERVRCPAPRRRARISSTVRPTTSSIRPVHAAPGTRRSPRRSAAFSVQTIAMAAGLLRNARWNRCSLSRSASSATFRARPFDRTSATIRSSATSSSGQSRRRPKTSSAEEAGDLAPPVHRHAQERPDVLRPPCRARSVAGVVGHAPHVGDERRAPAARASTSIQG